MIYKYSKNQNTVRLCKGNTCIEAEGKNADIIAGATAIMLMLVGIAAISNASR